MIYADILIIFAREAAAEWMITSQLINYLLGPIYNYTFHLSSLVNKAAFGCDRSGVKDAETL